jgi:hypothetical protein
MAHWFGMGDIDVRQTAAGPRYDVRFRDPTGRQRKKSFRTKKEAERFAASAVASMWSGQWVDPAAGRVTLGDYAATWMSSRQLRPRTRELYDSQLRLHILPHLGGIPLSRITPPEVRSWDTILQRRSGDGRSYRQSVIDYSGAVPPCSISMQRLGRTR